MQQLKLSSGSDYLAVPLQALWERKRELQERRAAVILRTPTARQRQILESQAKRKIIRAGRRSGKTTVAAMLAVREFLAGKRVLYAVPTQEQVDMFWSEVKRSLGALVDSGELYKNEVRHVLERPETPQRIRAKTAWNADTLRGDYADLLILDEYQLMHEDAWGLVGAPMLLDRDGNAVFIYTPPSTRAIGVSKAVDKMHAAKMFKAAQGDPRWAAFHFTSHDNPHISSDALNEITRDMTRRAYEQEILAQDKEDTPGALWTRSLLDECRVKEVPADLARVVVAVDPGVSEGGAETGIVVVGVGWCGCTGDRAMHGFVLDDATLRASPQKWAQQVAAVYKGWNADRVVAEKNNGGEMVELVLATAAKMPVTLVHASRGKYARAEPIAALYEKHQIHHVGFFNDLEDQLANWVPGAGERSPDRLDALVWGLTELQDIILAPPAVRADMPQRSRWTRGGTQGGRWRR